MKNYYESNIAISISMVLLFTLTILFSGEQAVAAGPHIMVFTDDSDRDSFERNSRVSKRVYRKLDGFLSEEGYTVSNEVFVTSKEGDDGSGGFAQGRSRRSPQEIADIARLQEAPPVDIAVFYQIYYSKKSTGYITKIKTRIAGWIIAVQSGQSLGEFEVKNRFTGPHKCPTECLQETVGDNARELSEDLASAIKIKLDAWTGIGDDAGIGGGELGGSHAGMAKGYVLNFKGFAPEERLEIERYLVDVFSGYDDIRATDCSRMNCKYWYTSYITSTHLNRNLTKMLMEMDIKNNISMNGNEFSIDRIKTRKKRYVPQNSGW